MENHKAHIKELLKANPRGLTITDISDRINVNRNSVARYMDILTISGQVEVRQLGPAKVFYLSQRVPLSAFLNFSSDYILVLDVDLKILQASENLLKLVNAKKDATIGLDIKDFPNPVFTSQEMLSKMREVLNGKEIIFEKKFRVAEMEYYFNTTMLPTIFEDGSQGVTWILKDITEHKRMEEAREAVLYDLGERMKELRCLYEISKLVEKPGISLEEILQGTKDLLPPAWQYPEVTCSRIILENKEYKTINYEETPWKQSSDIYIHGKKAGVVEVYYLEEKPSIEEGPFLKEEKDLITAIAERLGKIIERKKAEKIIENLAKFPSENPNPVLRVAKDRKILYANTAASGLLSKWNREIGQIAPSEWQQKINGILSSNESIDVEEELNGRQFSFSLIPVTGAGYVNIYGRDITKRKKA